MNDKQIEQAKNTYMGYQAYIDAVNAKQTE